ncbi:urease accessory protein UreE [Actibacterium mucosum KCTC 23349]|uniref:Urease accessory protein UreE n=1 Tax=Actibacterium mucosum KCTC 23349 TaxID=1454373 RepID=A0A037ZIP7_9RHOB|nr:urease accessory protein UreE [Actibacterium mucosum KCTC 23349]
MGIVHAIQRKPAGAVDDTLTLSYEARFLRRKRLTTDAGDTVLLDLAETTSLDDGDALELPNGGRIGIRAAAEPLLRVTGDSLPKLAWHIGNRHTPCQIAEDHLLLRHDHVLAKMLRQLGAEVVEIEAPFVPEGGAYGHGRTMGHDHGHDHHHHHEH